MANLIILFGLPGVDIKGYVNYITKNGITVNFNTITPEDITQGWKLKNKEHTIGLDSLIHSDNEDDSSVYIIGTNTVKDALSIYAFLNGYEDLEYNNLKWIFIRIDKKGKYNRLLNACKQAKLDNSDEVSRAFAYDKVLDEFMDGSNTNKNARFVFDLFNTAVFNDNIGCMLAYIPEKNDGIDMKTVCSVIKDFLSD